MGSRRATPPPPHLAPRSTACNRNCVRSVLCSPSTQHCCSHRGRRSTIRCSPPKPRCECAKAADARIGATCGFTVSDWFMGKSGGLAAARAATVSIATSVAAPRERSISDGSSTNPSVPQDRTPPQPIHRQARCRVSAPVKRDGTTRLAATRRGARTPLRSPAGRG